MVGQETVRQGGTAGRQGTVLLHDLVSLVLVHIQVAYLLGDRIWKGICWGHSWEYGRE